MRTVRLRVGRAFAVRGAGDWIVKLPGRAGLQGSDGRVVLGPVRVEVEDLSKLS